MAISNPQSTALYFFRILAERVPVNMQNADSYVKGSPEGLENQG
jgi:hypothetical protein